MPDGKPAPFHLGSEQEGPVAAIRIYFGAQQHHAAVASQSGHLGEGALEARLCGEAGPVGGPSLVAEPGVGGPAAEVVAEPPVAHSGDRACLGQGLTAEVGGMGRVRRRADIDDRSNMVRFEVLLDFGKGAAAVTDRVQLRGVIACGHCLG